MSDHRRKLVAYIYDAIDYNIVHATDTWVTVNVREMVAVIEDTVSLNHLEDEFISWQLNTNQRLGYSLYQKYEASISTRIAEVQSLNHYLERSELYPKAKNLAMFQSNIRKKIAYFEGQINDLREGGWVRALNEQRIQIVGLKSYWNSFDEECRSSIKNHQQKQTETKTLSDFRDLEEIYLRVIDTCTLNQGI